MKWKYASEVGPGADRENVPNRDGSLSWQNVDMTDNDLGLNQFSQNTINTNLNILK